MTGGTRMPTWKERENNKRRERRRRAIAAKIFAGLRLYGNYKLPKHCDNNEVLKALCNEAGWTVQPDGTTYRKGCRPIENMDIVGGSASVSPCSSYQPSPHTSYTPSPGSSSFPSPVSSTYAPSIVADGNSLIPWLRNLSASSSSSASSSKLMHQYMHGGSISAPVTPPLSSPTARTPRLKSDWDSSTFARPGWAGTQYPFLPLSTPPSPGRQTLPNSKWYDGVQIPLSGPTSPTFSLVSSNPFGFRVEDLTRGGPHTYTPGQSGTCSPAMAAAAEQNADIPMAEVISNEFAFGSNMSGGLVKPWEGERIHEECGPDELELTLGSSKTR
ncbi:BES1/BZR1-like protein 4 [Perilla frutescens var. hirtella]|nr:BES1/BZR1-like protein 4 [Perilla frutescens var. hirtella]